MKKLTISESVVLTGVGLHSGHNINVTIKPGDLSHGIRFKRVDLSPEVIINADSNHVVDTSRSTTIGNGSASISTVEHLLSALVGYGIDTVDIEVNGHEIPILDGSSKPFFEALSKVSKIELEEEKEYIVVDEPMVLKNDDGSQIIAFPFDGFDVNVIIDFPNTLVSQQTASFDNTTDYESQIAPCRTFVFTNELEYLFKNNLIKGGSLDNAIVLAEAGLTQEKLDTLAELLAMPKKELKDSIVLNDQPFKFDNELARHKLLDLLGDFALAGRPVKGKIIAIKPGHKINTEFAELLRLKGIEQRKLKGKPVYDPNKAPLMDVEQIKKLLPHRYPFLLVDKIIEKQEKMVIGVKNVTFNEQLFQGHFPDNPVFPGVLQMEALAQTGGILALSQVDNPQQWDTYFLKMDNVKFKNKVVPGDTMILKMELLSPIRRGIVHMQGTVYVGNKIVSEGELTAQIIKRAE